nr:PucR family transcriptional regulator [Rhodococcus sp. (in: high G+C Gram-positive bacteria)]
MSISTSARESETGWTIPQRIRPMRSVYSVNHSLTEVSNCSVPTVRSSPDAMGHRDFSLADLIADERLSLQLVTGDNSALSTPVIGAHALELEHPARWLESGWMMLTTGARLRNKPQAQRDLIVELQQLGVSCLGFGVGPTFRNVPPALLDEAKLRGFPVVLVPEEIAFRDIESAVFSSTQSMEAAMFSRLTSLQNNLVRALSDPNPLDSIVRRLSQVVHAKVAVVGLDGHAKAATGSLPLSEIAGVLAGNRTLYTMRAVVGDWHVLAAPVQGNSESSSLWLVVASRGAPVAGELAATAVQVTVPLIDAVLQLSTARLDQDRAARDSLLDEVIRSDRGSADNRSLLSRVHATGVEFGSQSRTVVLSERPRLIGGAQRLRSVDEVVPWLHSTLEGSGIPYLLTQRNDSIVLLLCDDDAIDLVCAELVESRPTMIIGIGREVMALDDIRSSYRDARIAVQHMALQDGRQVLRYDDLDLVTQLIGEVPADRFSAKAEAIVKLLEDNPARLEALRAFFAKNRDIKAAAESIHLHPNTLRYRLQRLEEDLGRSLQEASVTASLYCVLERMADISSSKADELAERTEHARVLDIPSLGDRMRAR